MLSQLLNRVESTAQTAGYLLREAGHMSTHVADRTLALVDEKNPFVYELVDAQLRQVAGYAGRLLFDVSATLLEFSNGGDTHDR